MNATVAIIPIGRPFGRFLISVLVPFALLAGCGASNVSPTLLAERELPVGAGVSRAATVERYLVVGDGPNGTGFTDETAVMPASISGIPAGRWEISVDGFDTAGSLVVSGSSTVDVPTGGQIELEVPLLPVGTGAVAVTVSWPPAQVRVPSVDVAIWTDGSAMQQLDVTIDPASGQAVATLDGISPGGYHLRTRLLDAGQVVAGEARLVAVEARSQTPLSVQLDQLNPTGSAIVVTGAEFVLAWDAGSSTSPDDPLVGYTLYYRSRGTHEWSLLGTTTATQRSFTVGTAQLAYGEYDFAVTSRSASGGESDLHTSLESTARPEYGWYLRWMPD